MSSQDRRPGSAPGRAEALGRPTRAGRARRPVWLSSLVLSAVSVAIAAVGMELAVRWMLSDTPPAIYWNLSSANRARWVEQRRAGGVPVTDSIDVPDDLLGWRNRANASVRWDRPGVYSTRVTTDGNGLRRVPSRDRTGARAVRVGIFGDSLTFGEGVSDDEVYAAYVQRALPDAEILNFGVHGYGTDQQLLYLKSEGGKYGLDVVVLGFAWFHLNRNTTTFGFFAKPAYALRDDELVLTNVPVPDPDTVMRTVDPDEASVLSHSWLARWAWQRVQNERERRLYHEASEPWRLTKRILQDFVTTARGHGSAVVIMSVDETQPALEEPFGAFVRGLGASYVNLGPALRAFGATREYRIPNDGHWNALGHAEVARVLSEHLCQMAIVPAGSCGPGHVRDRVAGGRVGEDDAGAR